MTTGRRRGWSIRTRLVVLLGVVVSLVIVVCTVLSTLAVRDYLGDRITSRLVASAERTRAALIGMNGTVALDTRTVTRMAAAESAGVVLIESGRAAWWVNVDADTARVLATMDLADGAPKAVPDRPDVVAIATATEDGLTVRDGAQVLRPDSVVIAYDAADDLGTFQRLVIANAAGMLVAIFLLVALTVVIVDRGLRPLRAMAEQAQGFAAGDRARRLPLPRDDVDMIRLATTVNEAFDAQQQAEGRLRAFVADASHELRSPLTIATGWTELYLQGGLGDRERLDHAMQRVETQLGRMRILIDELALLARLDRARPLAADPVDLTELVGDVVEDARVMNPDRTFTLRADGPAHLLGDAPRLQQVIANLAGNAVQHTPAGTPVEVTVIPAGRPGGHPGEHLVLVTDHGPGISPEDQAHVFERFWRADVSRDRHTGGSGLGLSIVASIVEAHGGTASVTSRRGHGTTFRVRLPAAVPDVAAHPLTRTPQVAHAGSAVTSDR